MFYKPCCRIKDYALGFEVFSMPINVPSYFIILLPCLQNYRGTLNHMNTSEFVKEFEQEHEGMRACPVCIINLLLPQVKRFSQKHAKGT